jgi:hypothetical protein
MLRELYDSLRTAALLPELREPSVRMKRHGSQTQPMPRIRRRIGLARWLRLLTMLAIPPLWSEITVLHYRGSFQNRSMWLPIMTLPLVGAAGVVSALTPNERQSRNFFRPFALWMTILGMMGTFFHVRGIKRQMGGFRNLQYNVITGPPFPAPMQVMFTGLLATTASAPPTKYETERLMRLIHLVNIPACLLFGLEAGWNHWMSKFFNNMMFIPITLSPLLAVTHAASLKTPLATRPLQFSLSAAAVVAGLIGFGFHTRNTSRKQGGFTMHNFFYGPPIAAPLQLTALGINGLLAAYYQARE